MKKTFLCLIALMMMGGSVNAQEWWLGKEEWRDANRWHDPFDIYAGPVVGMTGSNMSVYDSKYYFGPYIGGILQCYFSNHFGLSFEMGYTRQGARDAWQSFDSTSLGGPYEYRLDYLETLYKLRYYPIKNFDVFAGLQFGIHLFANSTLDGHKTDIKSHIKKRAAHIILGGGYEMENLYFEGFYGIPLSRLASSDLGKAALRDSKMSVFVVTVGYRFKLF